MQQIDKAVRTLLGWGTPLDSDEDVEAVVGLGPKTVDKVKEIVATGTSARMALVEADPKFKVTCWVPSAEAPARGQLPVGMPRTFACLPIAFRRRALLVTAPSSNPSRRSSLY